MEQPFEFRRNMRCACCKLDEDIRSFILQQNVDYLLNNESIGTFLSDFAVIIDSPDGSTVC